MIHASRLRA
uniref:Uncharacterized protein n=1 Tax=Rhizophora mucronata TaxID=61149 RepID=A0A2P2IXE3_RHIMU